jgi:hypothetical protein
MKELEKLIREMRKQLFPYHHEHDVERGSERWEISEGEYLISWLAGQLRICREKHKCDRQGRCVFYEYGDLSKRNYDICREIQIRLENGDITCDFRTEDDR